MAQFWRTFKKTTATLANNSGIKKPVLTGKAQGGKFPLPDKRHLFAGALFKTVTVPKHQCRAILKITRLVRPPE
ncbi:MAG: hypothetical protein U1D70_15365 [Methylobacter sp.]|nr:hypothetical protein [Methylobacter sp.]MDP2428310.1 hypothetical protein [Methylobacter sp.]MDP3055661.1 hypothetical protein [Methylobacter sp.]MDP3361403.1 hypothetical protein [Methylobacter sp.]MDZ4220383.1 hypothetical protein [Methylobacter sp.]